MRQPPPGSSPYVLEATQTLALPLDRVFAFFERPENLEAITPPWLHFHILTPSPIAMGAGALIDYRLRVRGVPLRWRTEITEYDPPHRFVDVQLVGPYRLWHHTHTFEPLPATAQRPDATLIRDRVQYLLPRIAPGPIGAAVNALIVGPDLRRVFAWRARRVAELLCAPPAPVPAGRGTPDPAARPSRQPAPTIHHARQGRQAQQSPRVAP